MHVVSIFSGPRFGAGSPNRVANMTGSIRWPRRIGSIPWPKRPTDGSSHSIHDESIDANRLHRTGCRSSLHAKRNARNHAVGRHQRILEERGGCLAEPFGMAPGGPYVELTGFSSRLFLLKSVAGG